VKILVVKGSEESHVWQEKVSGILSQISQRTGDDIQWLDIGQAWDILRKEGNGWDVAIVELPDSTLSENPESWSTPSWILPDWRSASHGVFAVSATNRARVLVCSYSQIPNSVREKLKQNGATIVRLDELALFHVDRVRRDSRRARVLDVVPTIFWMERYFGPDLPAQFQIPEYISSLMNDEVKNTRLQSEILGTALGVLGSSDFYGIETLFIAMQTARYLATLELEGEPYEITLAIGERGGIAEHLIIFDNPPTIGLQPSTLPRIRDICELAQGPDTCIHIDGNSGQVIGIFKAVARGDLGRISQLKATAERFKVLLLRIPGNGTVEIVGPKGIVCEHDGSEWQRWRLSRLKKKLLFVADVDGLNVLLEALDHLSSRRLSSIVAIQEGEFGDSADSVELKPLRSFTLPSAPRVATLTPLSLASLLRLDGSHLIFLNNKTHALEVERIAMNIMPKPSAPASPSHGSGTGEKAAAALSAAYPDAVVCKISASNGSVKVYREGEKGSDKN
jgi:hypothetical protein